MPWQCLSRIRGRIASANGEHPDADEQPNIEETQPINEGEYLYRLLMEPRWIERRVQTIDMLDGENWKQRVSIDLNFHTLASVAGFPEWPPKQPVIVPISILRKGLLLDLSVTDNDGHPLPVVASERSAEAWKSILVRSLHEHRQAANSSSNLSPQQIDLLSGDLAALVGPIDAMTLLKIRPENLLQDSYYALREAILRRLAAVHGIDDDARRSAWTAAMEISDFVHLLKCAIECFVALVELPTVNESGSPVSRTILKYSIQESQPFPSNLRGMWAEHAAQRKEKLAGSPFQGGGGISSLQYAIGLGVWHFSNDWKLLLALVVKTAKAILSFLGFRAHAVRLDTSLVGHAAREHVRLLCPPGVCISGPLQYTVSKSHAASDEVRVRTTRGRAMLYTRVREPQFSFSNQPRALVPLRPRLTGFLTPASIALTVSVLLSYLAWQRADFILRERDAVTDSLTTILLLSASLSSLYVARADEHKYRCTMLNWPRTSIALSGVAVGLIAVVMIFYPDAMAFAAESAFWICSLVAVYLFFYWVNAKLGKSTVRSNVNRTVKVNCG